MEAYEVVTVRGRQIKQKRERLGWSVADLASAAQVSPRAVHCLESGCPVRGCDLRAILLTLGMEVEDE